MNEHNHRPPTPEKKAEVERLFRAYHGKDLRPVACEPHDDSKPRLQSVVFRLPKSRMDALKRLAAETRVSQSVYLREAIQDVLVKHEEKP